jgi:putative holliday junction resolvase
MKDESDTLALAAPVALVVQRGTVLAFDYGTRRVGVAVGELDLKVAHPLGVIMAQDPQRLWASIGKLVAQWHPVMIVIGWPTHMDGGPHELGPLVERFAAEIEQRFDLPTVLIDEHLSSAVAAQSLREAGVSVKKQKAHLDSVAACEILQGLFARRPSEPYGCAH